MNCRVEHSLPTDTLVESFSIEAMYVAGDPSEPIPVQAPKVFQELEASLPTLRGRKFYGLVEDGEYRACVELSADHDASTLPFPTLTIPGGRYVHRRMPDWEKHPQAIGEAVDELCTRADYDPSRPVIEFYRSHNELVIRVPVN